MIENLNVNMFLSTLIRKVLKWWILFFSLCGFALVQTFPRTQYVAQAGLPLQSNLVYQTREL